MTAFKKVKLIKLLILILYIINISVALPLTLTSADFNQNGIINQKFTCYGASQFPTLIFNNIPKQTQSLGLIIEDHDAINFKNLKNINNNYFTHLILLNLPADIKIINQNNINNLLKYSGLNGDNKIGYFAFCPPLGPSSKIHHYYFKLYALNIKNIKDKNITAERFYNIVNNYKIDQAVLIGTVSSEQYK